MLSSQNRIPGICPHCGSEHFYEGVVNQYHRSPGVQDRALAQPIPVFICVCGFITPAKVLNQKDPDHMSLQAALRVAWQHHEQKTGRSQTEVQRDFVTHAEYEALTAKITALETELQLLTKPKQK